MALWGNKAQGDVGEKHKELHLHITADFQVPRHRGTDAPV